MAARLAVIEGAGGRFLEQATDFAGIAVGEVRPLDHEDVGDATSGIDPGLGSPGASVAEGSGRQHGGDTVMGFAEYAGAQAPTVMGSASAEGFGLEEAGRQVAGLGQVHPAEGFVAEVAAAAEGAVGEQHLAEAGVIAAGGVETAVAQGGPIGTAEVMAWGHGVESGAVGVSGVGGGQAAALSFGGIEGGVAHAERAEEALFEEDVEGLTADDFDDAGGGVDSALAVAPAGAGFELHGSRQPQGDQVGERACLLGGRAGGFAETADVGEHLEQGDVGGVAGGRAQGGELGNVLGHRIGDLQAAFILEHEDGGGGDRFGHGGDPEQGVLGHATIRGEVGEAGGFVVKHPVFGHHQGDGSGDLVLGYLGFEGLADAGKFAGARVGDEGQTEGGAHEERTGPGTLGTEQGEGVHGRFRDATEAPCRWRCRSRRVFMSTTLRRWSHSLPGPGRSS